VPVVLLLDIEDMIIGLESLAVAKPKSAKHARPAGVINMLSWSEIRETDALKTRKFGRSRLSGLRA
jgi:hypothetical protein